MRNHTVVIGYGTKGRTAVEAMIGDGIKPAEIVVVDGDAAALEAAAQDGLVTVRGDATKSDVLRLAGVAHAAAIVVATNRDDTAVLATLTAREINPRAKIVASIREAENQHLMRQSGANSVVVSSETAGRLLGIATKTPTVVEVIEDLLTPDEGVFDRRTRGGPDRDRGLAQTHQGHRAGRRPRGCAVPGRQQQGGTDRGGRPPAVRETGWSLR